jgi:hypothetical protein
MNALVLVVGWLVLFAVSWPLAVAALLLAPLVWLLALPFRVVGVCVRAALALLEAVLFLPARVLGHRR